MFKKQLWAILLAFSLILLLAGCGGGTSDTSTEDTENSAESEMTEEKTDTTGDASALEGTWRVEKTTESGTATVDYTFDKDGNFTLYETYAEGQPGEGIDETESTSGTGKGTYTVDGDKLTCHFDEISSEGVTYEGQTLSDDLKGSDTVYTYKLDGDKLTLDTDGKTETLTKIATDTAQDQAADSQGDTSTETTEQQ